MKAGIIMKNTFVTILLISVFFSGCSSPAPKQTSVFTDEQQAELKAIFDKYLTDQDWERYQQEWEKKENLVNNDEKIDLRNDYDKDPMILMVIVEMSSDKPQLQKELTSFINKTMLEEVQKNGEKGRLEDFFNE